MADLRLACSDCQVDTLRLDTALLPDRRRMALALCVIAPAFLFVMGYFDGYTNRYTI
ncbi:MAG TPA: hypothetical protein VHD90_19195 [Phototrophicaceae bacterium]|nr:hypothetical protein [Phototrophicaceae bacterium]